MARRQSAGILLYRLKNGGLEVFLVHPGGPFWKKKDAASWTIPKGEFTDEEEALAAAIREFREETSFTPVGPFIPLTPVTQKGGKRVYAWTAVGDIVPALVKSNLVTIEWPPKSGKKIHFPEVDTGDWFPLEKAYEKINPAQAAFLDELKTLPPSACDIL